MDVIKNRSVKVDGIALRITYRMVMLLLFFLVGFQQKSRAVVIQIPLNSDFIFCNLTEEDACADSSIAPAACTSTVSDEKNKNKQKKQEDKIEKDEEDDYYSRVLTFADVMPTYPDGDAALVSYIARSIRYPQSALEAGVSGRVICIFVVNEDGSLSDIEILRGISRALDMEAVRVLKTMPKWVPGFQDGRKVKVKCSLPITFRLE